MVPDTMLGLMVGHWDALAPATTGSLRAEAVNMGIAIVVPGKRVLETIDGPEVSPVLRDGSEVKLEGEVSLDFDSVVFSDDVE